MSIIGDIFRATGRFLHNLRIDNFVGMTLASLSVGFIVIAGASTLNKTGIAEINTAADAAPPLEPLVEHTECRPCR